METQENVSKHNLKDVQAHFGISRTKLYKIRKEQGIEATKEGRDSYISDTDFTQLKNVLENTDIAPQKKTGTNTGTKNTSLIDHLQQQLKREQQKNDQLTAENKTLLTEAGRWEGVAKALEKQNTQLLELKAPEDIHEAEIVEDEQENTEEAEIVEEKPKKKGWFSFFR